MGWVTTTRSRGLLGESGLVISAASLALLPLTRAAPLSVWVGVGLLAISGSEALRERGAGWRWITRLLGAAGLGWAVAPLSVPYLPWALLGAVLLAVPLAADLERRHPAPEVPLGLFALSALGVYSSVPDTEEALVVGGVSAAVALVAGVARIAGRRPGLGAAGVPAATGLLLWTVAAGGFGKPGSMVGAAAGLGLLVAEPVGARLRRRAGRRVLPAWIWWVAQAVLVLVCARWAGLERQASTAAIIAGPSLLVAIWVGGRLGAPLRDP